MIDAHNIHLIIIVMAFVFAFIHCAFLLIEIAKYLKKFHVMIKISVIAIVVILASAELVHHSGMIL